MRTFNWLTPLLLVFVVPACATPPDVSFEGDAFRAVGDANPNYEWVAWTSRGFEVDGELVAASGEGCLPEEGWPQVIRQVPGGFWLYGVEPSMTEEVKVTFDCVIEQSEIGMGYEKPRTVSSADGRAWKLAMKPSTTDNFGMLRPVWYQQGQQATVQVLDPSGVETWRLSEQREPCWLVDFPTIVSACLPTSNAPGVSIKTWEHTPEGRQVTREVTLALDPIPPGDARVWMGYDGRLAVAASAPNSTKLWVRSAPDEDVWSTEGLVVTGTVLSVAFFGPISYVLSVDSAAEKYVLTTIENGRVNERNLPEHQRPKRLEMSFYFSASPREWAARLTLWGVGMGAAWKLEEPR